MCRWNFERIIPAHFVAPIEAKPRDLREAARFLERDPAVIESRQRTTNPIALALMDALNNTLLKPTKADAEEEEEANDYPESELELLRSLTNFLTITGIAGKVPSQAED